MPDFFEEALRDGYERFDGDRVPPDAPPQPAGASNIYLRDPRTGTGFWLTEGVTDHADGVADADFDFDAGARWSAREARVASTDTSPGDNALKTYWTKNPEGLAKWATKPHPWTALYEELVQHMPPGKAKKVTSAWYELVFGMPVGMKKGKNPHGPG